MSLKIKKIESNKSKIKQRPNASAGIIPLHPKVSIFNGAQGSGKTTLIVNLLQEAIFYGKKNGKMYFDDIILFTNSDDDMYDNLIKKKILKESLIKFNPTPEDIQQVIDHQTRIIKKDNDISKAPKILIIFEDIITNRKIMKSKAFSECFFKPRHLNFSVWLLTQYLNSVPKGYRMQADHIFSFKGNKLETEILEEHFTPAGYCKKCFRGVIYEATKPEEDDKFPFLHINKRQPVEKRFRRNLDTYLHVNCTHM